MRLTEEAAVLAVKLADAFIPNLYSRTAGVEIFCEHSRPCRLKPQLLLILHRAHRGHLAKVVMERGNAHARQLREFLDPDPSESPVRRAST